MEQLNPLDRLNLLEQKILSLVEIIKAEKELIAQLTQENAELTLRLEMLENSLLQGTQNIEELNQERVLTKMVVDELISSIDRLVEHEPQR